MSVGVLGSARGLQDRVGALQMGAGAGQVTLIAEDEAEVDQGETYLGVAPSQGPADQAARAGGCW
jgi:hypothetical protein